MRVAVAVVLVAIGLAAAGCGAVGMVTAKDGNAEQGKVLFKANCGGCHTLANAGTTGTIGPDLDAAFAAAKSKNFVSPGTEQTIRDIVRGQIAYADSNPDTGTPQNPTPGMPANILQGQQARDVAVYVAECAADPHCNVAASSS